MATKIDVSALTLNAQEAQSTSEAVFEKTFMDESLSSIHNVVTGVSMKQQIVFIAQLAIGGEALSGCTPAEQDSLVLSEKFWEPVLVAGRYKHCAADLSLLLKIFRRAQKADPDFFDRIGSEEISLLVAKVIEGIKQSIDAKVWFSAKNAAVQPGGDFTIAGFNAGIWNQFDGLWEQIFADSNVPVVTISENSGDSYANQALTAGKSVTILQGMYEKADSRLISDPDAQFLVTRSIWDNYLTAIEAKQAAGGIIERLENGSPTLSYRGIPIKMKNDWDRNIEAYQNDLTVTVLPHRALLTTPGNIPVATLAESDLNSVESFYDAVTKSNYVDYEYFLDAKFGEAYMAVAAY